MPVFSHEPRTFSDPSALNEGMHPGFLVAVTDEETPKDWAMFEKSPRMWRWYFAVWNDASVVLTAPPELQSTVSSQTFSPGGKYQASKAYVWSVSLLNRQIAKGEKLDIDAMVPLPCMLYLTRRDKQGQYIEQAIIKDLAPWPEGLALLTEDFRSRLLAWWKGKEGGQANPNSPDAPRPVAPVAPPVAPAVPTAQVTPLPPANTPPAAAPAKAAVNW
jgi:hypothetical protein